MTLHHEAAIIAIRRFVDRVRRRARAEDAMAGVAAFVCGTCAATVGWSLASGGAGVVTALATLATLVGAAGCVVALLGARLLARAALRPPSATRAAAWIERAIPELRDALATAVEAGPLAELSAEYAAPRIADARVGALLPAPARRARAALVAGAVGILLVVSVATAMVKPGARPPVHGAGGGRAIGQGLETAAPPGALGTLKASGATAAVTPAGGRERRMTLRAIAAPRDRAAGAGSVDATEILVSSPRGFERAVELFVAGGKAARREGDGPQRKDEPAP